MILAPSLVDYYLLSHEQRWLVGFLYIEAVRFRAMILANCRMLARKGWISLRTPKQARNGVVRTSPRPFSEDKSPSIRDLPW